MRDRRQENLVITVGGLHGTGKSTYAKALARIYKLRHLSAGELFRQIAKERGITLRDLSYLTKGDRSVDEVVDGRIKEAAEKGDVVIDGLLAAFMASGRVHVKTFLVAPDEVRFRRIAHRDKISFAESRRLTLERERIERERYMNYYNLNIDDLTVYDIVLNTGLLSLRSNINVLVKVIDEYIRCKM